MQTVKNWAFEPQTLFNPNPLPFTSDSSSTSQGSALGGTDGASMVPLTALSVGDPSTAGTLTNVVAYFLFFPFSPSPPTTSFSLSLSSLSLRANPADTNPAATTPLTELLALCVRRI